MVAAIISIACEENPYGPTGYQPDIQKPDKEEQQTPPPAEKAAMPKGLTSAGSHRWKATDRNSIPQMERRWNVRL